MDGRVMDAQLVWNTWRRVLTSDRLAGWVGQPPPAKAPPGLTADELAIVADYAGTPAATRSNIGMYRRGLVRNALGALDLVPLTRRLLHASGLSAEAVAEDFTRSAGYADDGPNFWRTAAGFVAYLAGLPDFASPAWQDVLAIDAATAALARRLGESPAGQWPDSTAAQWPDSTAADGELARFAASRAAVVVRSRCDLTPWLENPFDFDAGAGAEPSPRHWLVYFPAAEAAHEYAELSQRAARALDLLQTPMTAAGLSHALGLPRADALAVIGSLARLGVAFREAAPVAAGAPGAGRPAPPPLATDAGLAAR